MENLKKASAEAADQMIKMASNPQLSPQQKLDLLIPALTLLNAIVEEE